jgi:SAM-dependent methyltransferase
LSEQSIEYAIGKSNSNLTFAVHDMRQKFGVNLYDFVLNLFTSIGYFITLHDNQKVIQNISSALIKNGILVIDFLNVHLLEDLKKAPVLLEKTIENVKFITTKKIENQFIIKDIEVYDGAKKLAYQERVQALSLLDFTQFLSKSNLQITHLFGDYNLTEFNENTSPRLIIIAKKIPRTINLKP